MKRCKIHLSGKLIRELFQWTDYHSNMNTIGLGDHYTDRPHIDDLIEEDGEDVMVFGDVPPLPAGGGWRRMILAFVGVGFVVDVTTIVMILATQRI